MPQAEAEIYQHYRVLRREDERLWELGRGGMGVTYKAVDSSMGRFVALKVIKDCHAGSATARKRFIREAKAAARLQHPNVATVFHLGWEEQTCFYAMEFIEGESLGTHLKRAGPLSCHRVLLVALQVAKALRAAARVNLIHRDIKPDNLMLVRQDGMGAASEAEAADGDDDEEFHVKVIDFGLVKLLARDESADVSLTGGLPVGTPYFMSPEQIDLLADEPDARTDFYSLGATLWCLLTGLPPFSGTQIEVFRQHRQSAPPVEQLPAAVPAPVRALLLRLLAKNPEARPANADDLLREIKDCLRACGADIPAATPMPEPHDAEPVLEMPSETSAPVEGAPAGFSLEDTLRLNGGRLPAAFVADLLGPLAQIVDAAGTARLDLAPGGVWIVDGDARPTPLRCVPFTDDLLTGGVPGWLEVRPPVAARPPIQPAGETMPPPRARFTEPAAALAALAYELLGGTAPEVGRGYRALSECDEESNALLRRALEAGPGAFADASALGAELGIALRRRRPISNPVVPAPEREPAVVPVKRGRGVIVILALLAALALAAVLCWRPHPKPAPGVRLADAKAAVQSALVEAESISDDEEKCDALSKIAVAQAHAGDTAASRQTLAQAVQTAASIKEDYQKSDALSKIAVAQANAGDANGGLQTAGSIKDDSQKSDALSKIAAAQAKSGGAKAGLQTAGTIKDYYDKCDALSKVAVAQAEAGDRTGALLTAQSVEDDEDKADALSKIAVAQAKRGDTAGSRQTLAQALQTAQGIKDDYKKFGALSTVATAQAKAGDATASRQTFSQALQTAESIRDDYKKSGALSKIARAQAEAGDVDGGLQTAQNINDGYDKSDAFDKIAEAQAKAGDVNGGLRTAGSIEDDYDKSDALSKVAAAQAKAGDAAASRQTFAQALSAAQNIQASDDRDQANRMRETYFGLYAAHKSKHYNKFEALSQIAVAQAGSDDIAAAESTVKLLSPGKDRSEGYIAVAEALLKGPDASDDGGL